MPFNLLVKQNIADGNIFCIIAYFKIKVKNKTTKNGGMYYENFR